MHENQTNSKNADSSKTNAPNKDYIFGYGSLIEDASRERTTASARYAFPVVVKGIVRGWWARGGSSGLTTTYLGALEDDNATCNGVIYAVTEEELAETDARETAGYKRCLIQPQNITMLDGRNTPPEGNIWVYVNQFSRAEIRDNIPTAQFPMVQSYLDICVNGCLEVEARYPTAAGFTKEFLTKTAEWNRFWVNDRSQPRRAFAAQPAAEGIDEALLSVPETAELYYEVEIEPASWEDRKPVKPGEARARPARRVGLLRPGWGRGG